MGTEIHFSVKKKLKNPVLFIGLPGIGLVGKIAIDYMVKQLNPKKIADIYSTSFPPSIYTNDGIINLISDEIYLYETKKRDFLFVIGPVQPSLSINFASTEQHYEFSAKLVELAIQLGVKEVYTLAGINVGDKRMESKPQIVIAATHKDILKSFKEAEINKTGGLISGAAGLILGMVKQRGLKGACIMGETNARLIYGDHGAAKKIIETIAELYGFKLDMKGIKKESKNIEDAFKQLSKQMPHKEEEEHHEDLTYVR